MSILYQVIERQVSAALGTILGSDVAAVDANYTTAGSSANRNNPDFPPSYVQDAILGALSDIVETICSTPHHPERATFAAITAALANRATLPRVTSTSAPIIGTFGRCYDSSNNNELLPGAADMIRSFTRNPNSMYTGLNIYWYAFDGNAILHTRTNVVLDCCTWTRPTYASASNIPVDDYHERGLVAGAVVHLAPREGAYLPLYNAYLPLWQAHLALIRSMGDPLVATDAQSAPAAV